LLQEPRNELLMGLQRRDPAVRVLSRSTDFECDACLVKTPKVVVVEVSRALVTRVRRARDADARSLQTLEDRAPIPIVRLCLQCGDRVAAAVRDDAEGRR